MICHILLTSKLELRESPYKQTLMESDLNWNKGTDVTVILGFFAIYYRAYFSKL